MALRTIDPLLLPPDCLLLIHDDNSAWLLFPETDRQVPLVEWADGVLRKLTGDVIYLHDRSD